MSKHFLLLVIIVFCYVTGLTQVTNQHSFVELSIGTSLPIGKFANKTHTISPGDSTGLAKIGFGFNLSLNYRIKNSIGIMALIGNSFNKQDKNAYDNYFRKTYGNDAKTEIGTDSWQIWKILAGPFFETQVSKSKNIYLRTRLLSGICKSIKPAYTIIGVIGTNPGNTITVKESRGKDHLQSAFCYQLNAGLIFKTSKKYFFSANLDFFSANPHFTYYYRQDPNAIPIVFLPATGRFELSSISIQAGAGINF